MDLLFPTGSFIELSFSPTDIIGMVYTLDDGTGVYEVVNASDFTHQMTLPGYNTLAGTVKDSVQTKVRR